MGSFCSYYLCSVLLFSSVLSTWPWCVPDFPSLPKGVRHYEKYILSLWYEELQHAYHG